MRWNGGFPGWVAHAWAAALAGGASGCAEFHLIRPEVRYVAIGDSTTDGPTELEYPDALGELLGAEPAAFANEGHGGDTADEAHERLEALIEADIFPNAQALLYWAGGSDIVRFIREHDPLLLESPDAARYPYQRELQDLLDTVQASIEDALSTAHAAGWDAYAATYFFIRSDIQSCEALLLPVIFPGQAVVANAYLELLNKRVRAAAAAQGAVVVDIAAEPSITADSGNYEDCNHLSVEGNRRAAAVFAEALSSNAVPAAVSTPE